VHTCGVKRPQTGRHWGRLLYWKPTLEAWNAKKGLWNAYPFDDVVDSLVETRYVRKVAKLKPFGVVVER